MPQLDPTTFAPQLFWLLVTFVLLYLVMWKIILPKIGGVLQDRQERIDDDLEKAEQLRKEAEAVKEAYEQTVAEGRSKAQETIRAAGEKIAADAAEQHAALTEKLAAQTSDAEARIVAAKEEALKNIRTVATEVTQAAAGRLIGREVSDSEAEAAVGAVFDEEQR
ncbi:MAG: F0F1 ATP synthase subunit B' [Rhodospirillaceae bacterium]|nr:F0F1 ATP synthase subunit B' [Rhodospirillaceae bacterium]|tara:strand:- start:5538 stop:6032 length:495 start_codon:yes stop_codon:yes gene_type:complete